MANPKELKSFELRVAAKDKTYVEGQESVWLKSVLAQLRTFPSYEFTSNEAAQRGDSNLVLSFKDGDRSGSINLVLREGKYELVVKLYSGGSGKKTVKGSIGGGKLKGSSEMMANKVESVVSNIILKAVGYANY